MGTILSIIVIIGLLAWTGGHLLAVIGAVDNILRGEFIYIFGVIWNLACSILGIAVIIFLLC